MKTVSSDWAPALANGPRLSGSTVLSIASCHSWLNLRTKEEQDEYSHALGDFCCILSWVLLKRCFGCWNNWTKDDERLNIVLLLDGVLFSVTSLFEISQLSRSRLLWLHGCHCLSHEVPTYHAWSCRVEEFQGEKQTTHGITWQSGQASGTQMHPFRASWRVEHMPCACNRLSSARWNHLLILVLFGCQKRGISWYPSISWRLQNFLMSRANTVDFLESSGWMKHENLLKHIYPGGPGRRGLNMAGW